MIDGKGRNEDQNRRINGDQATKKLEEKQGKKGDKK